MPRTSLRAFIPAGLALRERKLAELGFDLLPHALADIDHRREGPFEILVVGDARIDQDAVIEVAGKYIGSRFEAQAFWIVSMSVIGSNRVDIAHST